jgi:hypothetical protein
MEGRNRPLQEKFIHDAISYLQKPSRVLHAQTEFLSFINSSWPTLDNTEKSLVIERALLHAAQTHDESGIYVVGRPSDSEQPFILHTALERTIYVLLPKIRAMNPSWADSLVKDHPALQSIPIASYGLPTTELRHLNDPDSYLVRLRRKHAEVSKRQQIQLLARTNSTKALQMAINIPNLDVRARVLAEAVSSSSSKDVRHFLLTQAYRAAQQTDVNAEKIDAMATIAEVSAKTTDYAILDANLSDGLLQGIEIFRESTQIHPATPVYQTEVFSALSRLVRVGAAEGRPILYQRLNSLDSNTLAAYLLVDVATGISSKTRIAHRKDPSSAFPPL